MDPGIVSVLAALITAIASIAVAWISTRRQTDRPDRLSPNINNYNDTNAVGISKTSMPSQATSDKFLAPIPRDLLMISHIVLWVLHIATVYVVFAILAFILVAATDGTKTMKPSAGTAFFVFCVLAIILVPITVNFHKRVRRSSMIAARRGEPR
jgi:hypothetical protein